MQQVNAVTLAHLKFFAGDRPAEPIFRALRIEDAGEIQRLLKIAKRLDVGSSDNPAAEAEFLATNWYGATEDDPCFPAQRTYNNVISPSTTLNDLLHEDDAHGYPTLNNPSREEDTYRNSKVGWFARSVGLAVSALLLYAVVVRTDA